MAKDKKKFPFLFKLDKNKLKLQLKGLSDKLKKGKIRGRWIVLMLTLFFLIGVGIAIYNYTPYNQSDFDFQPDFSFEPGFNFKQEELAIGSKEDRLLQLEDERIPSQKTELKEEMQRDEPKDVLTESPLKPLSREISEVDLSLIKPVSGEILQEAGWYHHPIFADWRYQVGVKFEANSNDLVMAVAAGKVVAIEDDDYKGIVVTIEHENAWQSLYGHLQKTVVSLNDYVAKGQEIGRVGQSGVIKEPSLYFELKTTEGYINPEHYFK